MGPCEQALRVGPGVHMCVCLCVCNDQGIREENEALWDEGQLRHDFICTPLRQKKNRQILEPLRFLAEPAGLQARMSDEAFSWRSDDSVFSHSEVIRYIDHKTA